MTPISARKSNGALREKLERIEREIGLAKVGLKLLRQSLKSVDRSQVPKHLVRALKEVAAEQQSRCDNLLEQRESLRGRIVNP